MLTIIIISSRIALLLGGASGKVVRGSAALDGVHSEHELAKFAYDVGDGSMTANLWVDDDGEGVMYGDQRHHSLSVYAYTDERRRAVERAPSCEEKGALAEWRVRVPLQRKFRVEEFVATSNSARVWFFVLADCSLEQYYHEVPVVRFEIEMRGPGRQHLPFDEKGMGRLHAVNSVASAIVCATSVRAHRGKPHVAAFILEVSAALDAVSSLCEWRHITAFARDGVGSYFFDATAALLEATCDAAIAALLLAIGAGWTLRASLSDDEKAGRSPLREETLPEQAASAVAPLATALRAPLALPPFVVAAFFGIHLVLAQWSRIYDDDFDSFHDWEHLPGRILVVFRVFLALVFVPISLRTQACAGTRLRRFYVGWALVGTAWFLALPALSLIAAVSPAATRHARMSGGSALVQTASLLSLALLFSGAFAPYYHSISTVGQADANLDLGGAPNHAVLKLAGIKVRLD
ncbi:hypothetical protein CTAYLR_000932 [Chrysophaeum taylorii]|uniref:GPR180/TMEM145 transmembrane domain-containing protein n=1 Tax=Chrysophaeum taylorii TaxID=2483200 RepID=A0AAD7UFD3_9STRA|nr:hypothetical protein CTAYLR_000932 [Chrysophaeum taylorii]